MKPVMFCKNTSGILRWLQSSMKCAPLMRRLGKDHAVIGDDADRAALDMGKARDQRFAKARLEFVKARAVDDAGDHLADVIGGAQIGGHDAEDLLGVIGRGFGRLPDHGLRLRRFRPATARRASASAWASSSAR
jgi:hypothetical protein